MRAKAAGSLRLYSGRKIWPAAEGAANSKRSPGSREVVGIKGEEPAMRAVREGK